jgi:hypothetical protein
VGRNKGDGRPAELIQHRHWDARVGLHVCHLLPALQRSLVRRSNDPQTGPAYGRFARIMPTAPGVIHLRPAYQRREFVIGDGLHILETIFLPRTGMDDEAAGHTVVCLKNRTPHPPRITLVACLDLRAATPHDIVAEFDHHRRSLVAHNASSPGWVGVFGSDMHPEHHCATTAEEMAYSPGQPPPDRIDGSGDLTGSLQFDILLLPGLRHKLRLTAAFSSHGRRSAATSVPGRASSPRRSDHDWRQSDCPSGETMRCLSAWGTVLRGPPLNHS